ncbi:hypothetical protein RP20_CCG021297 [Aedes albopictus]|nr:hypothetical protein RP20_CCG021297 [Aedes albopictus]
MIALGIASMAAAVGQFSKASSILRTPQRKPTRIAWHVSPSSVDHQQKPANGVTTPVTTTAAAAAATTDESNGQCGPPPGGGGACGGGGDGGGGGGSGGDGNPPNTLPPLSSNTYSAFKRGNVIKGILCPSMTNSFRAPSLERSYLTYSHRQRQKSLILVNVVDLVLKIVLASVWIGFNHPQEESLEKFLKKSLEETLENFLEESLEIFLD